MEHRSQGVNEFHSGSDVDTSAYAQHHTLGPTHLQAAPGDHTHDGTNSFALGIFDIGDVKMSARSSPSKGWLACNGAAISRTTYADLFAAIGTTFGIGDGSTTFNLPTVQDCFALGAGGAHALGATGGSTTIALANIPAHNHGTGTGAHSHAPNFSTATGTSGTNIPLGTVTTDRTSNAAFNSSTNMAPSAHTHNTEGSGTAYWQPYTALNFFIRYA